MTLVFVSLLFAVSSGILASKKKIETLLAGSLQDYYLVPLLYL